MTTPDDVARARECTDFIGREVARLGQWKGLGSALARGNVEKHIAALLAEARAEGFAAALERAENICLNADVPDSMAHRLADAIRALSAEGGKE